MHAAYTTCCTTHQHGFAPTPRTVLRTTPQYLSTCRQMAQPTSPQQPPVIMRRPESHMPMHATSRALRIVIVPVFGFQMLANEGNIKTNATPPDFGLRWQMCRRNKHTSNIGNNSRRAMVQGELHEFECSC